MQNTLSPEDAARRILDLLTTLGRRHPLRDPLAQAVEAMGLTPPQFHALLWLGSDEPLTMGELARRIGVTEKTITGIVDRLERQDLVQRDRTVSDRRVIEVSLTGKGRLVYMEMDEQIVARTTMLLSALPDADRVALLRIVEGMVDRLTASETSS
jgi:DNA-binding MarR family transcriptional regulator